MVHHCSPCGAYRAPLGYRDHPEYRDLQERGEKLDHRAKGADRDQLLVHHNTRFLFKNLFETRKEHH